MIKNIERRTNFNTPSSTVNKPDFLDQINNEDFQESLARRTERERREISEIKKQVEGEKEEFDYGTYIEIKFGSRPNKIDPIGAHVEEAAYYLLHPEIKTMADFVDHQEEIEG